MQKALIKKSTRIGLANNCSSNGVAKHADANMMLFRATVVGPRWSGHGGRATLVGPGADQESTTPLGRFFVIPKKKTTPENDVVPTHNHLFDRWAAGNSVTMVPALRLINFSLGCCPDD
ncbi:hypothetical protein [Glaciimonas immobilis]|uniref:Uncharacterized protein n=1 Tax=Glaciimonas immobilis TaxID=728004 RepID=A0A840RTG1_9BURK|nr:hypothetical protein [Glaciimonas immobilis]KAF3999756.1 hypothetical protein HAV38_00740 [Glaciimonas immobilis]MBB5200216.1 hypothetical protein [Glaciimonas immobilis]